MSRKLRAAVAQLGPIHLADTRTAVVKRHLKTLEVVSTFETGKDPDGMGWRK